MYLRACGSTDTLRAVGGGGAGLEGLRVRAKYGSQRQKAEGRRQTKEQERNIERRKGLEVRQRGGEGRGKRRRGRGQTIEQAIVEGRRGEGRGGGWAEVLPCHGLWSGAGDNR